MEILDVFDSKMNHIGVEDREEIHKKGLWHQTFHCWIIKKIGKKNYVIVQKRDRRKKVAPNCLDITAAGHLHAGEKPIDGIRELQEELGIMIDSGSVINLGIRISSTESENNINKEFCHVYFVEVNLALNEYNLQVDEVSGLVEIEINDGIALFTNKVDTIKCTSLSIEDGGKKIEEIDIAIKDFIPRIDAYYLKVFIMAERFFEGKEGLAI